MSVIFGKCSMGDVKVDNSDLYLMRDTLNHWQADDANVWTSEGIGMGHLMLHNTPESLNEKLPEYNDVYGLAITADARIDNRDELYKLLQLKAPEEKKIPDSTLILLLYKKYGAECVQYLVGDFAFAIWDTAQHILFCARDHMGVKPFFYYHDGRSFVFATEKKGILCLPGIDKKIDKQFFYNQVLEPIVQAQDTTLYKKIRRLPPAHTLTFYPHNNSLQLTKYWELDAGKETQLAKKEDYYEGLLHHFDQAVKCRLRSCYTIGAELSGGLDSSAITGAATRYLKEEGRQLITFSNASVDGKLVFAPGWEDERKYIEAVNEFNGIKDSVIITQDIWDRAEDEIDFALSVNDGLDMWAPTWLMPIKRAAQARNVRTMLSGFPGDEMVTYRGQFFFLDYLDKKQYAKYFFEKTKRPFNKFKPFIHPNVEFALHKLNNWLTLNYKEGRDIAAFFGMPAKARFAKGDVVWEDIYYRERYKSYRHFQKFRLLRPHVGLRMEAENRFGLYCRSESRFPMADIRLTQFYLSMPNELKFGGELTRSTFRMALQQYLPPEVLVRDGKLSNIMPFKTTPEAIAKRQAFTLSMASNFENKSIYNNVITKKIEINYYNRLKFLEALRWFEKNFENCME